MTRTSEGQRFWGHLILQFSGMALPQCYPISADTRAHIRERMLAGRSGCGWVIVNTLNNRVLAFDPKCIQRIWLLDDADEWPDGFDGENPLEDYAGIPTEMYALMAAWTDGPHEFSVAGPPGKRKEALALIERSGFTNRPMELAALLRHTVVHFVDGSRASYEADRANLVDLVEIEDDPGAEMVEISASENAFESFFPLDMLRLIEIPALELEAAQSELVLEC